MTYVTANENAKKEFKIPVSWEVSDFVKVQADTLEEALEYMEEHEDEIPIDMSDAEYIDGSYQYGSYEESALYNEDIMEEEEERE